MKYSLLSLMVGLLITSFAFAGKAQATSCKSQTSIGILGNPKKVVAQNSKPVFVKKQSAQK